MSISELCLVLGVLCIIIPICIVIYNAAMDKASDIAKEYVHLKISEHLNEKKLAIERATTIDDLNSIIETIESFLEVEGQCKVSILMVEVHYKEIFVYPLFNRLFAIPLIKQYNGNVNQSVFLSFKSLVIYQLTNEIKRLKKNNLTY